MEGEGKMKYPIFWKKIIGFLSVISGSLVMLIAILSVYESISRFVFECPTSWSLNSSQYILIWMVFLGSAYAFQERGHVAVDLFQDAVEKHWGRTPRRVMAIIGHLLAVVFVASLLYGGINLTKNALSYHMVTSNTSPISLWILYIAIAVGSVLMLVTLVFILLDLFGKGEKYL
jgi:TRAP-type C4-dicarboxylate transport system permease small subunit